MISGGWRWAPPPAMRIGYQMPPLIGLMAVPSMYSLDKRLWWWSCQSRWCYTCQWWSNKESNHVGQVFKGSQSLVERKCPQYFPSRIVVLLKYLTTITKRAWSTLTSPRVSPSPAWWTWPCTPAPTCWSLSSPSREAMGSMAHRVHRSGGVYSCFISDIWDIRAPGDNFLHHFLHHLHGQQLPVHSTHHAGAGGLDTG